MGRDSIWKIIRDRGAGEPVLLITQINHHRGDESKTCQVVHLPDSDDFDGSEKAHVIPQSIKEKVANSHQQPQPNISRDCRTCRHNNNGTGWCYDWPRCTIIYDKWVPAKRSGVR